MLPSKALFSKFNRHHPSRVVICPCLRLIHYRTSRESHHPTRFTSTRLTQRINLFSSKVQHLRIYLKPLPIATNGPPVNQVQRPLPPRKRRPFRHRRVTSRILSSLIQEVHHRRLSLPLPSRMVRKPPQSIQRLPRQNSRTPFSQRVFYPILNRRTVPTRSKLPVALLPKSHPILT